MRRLLVWVAVLGIPGCATAEGVVSPREGYILAHDHGWVEVAILDDAIPIYATTDESGEVRRSVPTCSVAVELNDEPFLRAQVFPAGSSEPYRVDSGFRFPAPVGLFAARLGYSGCRGSEEADRELPFTLMVASDQKTVVAFDGDAVDARAPEPDEAVTLQSLDARLDRIERALRP